MNPLVAQLTHRPFPEVAGAVRSHAGRITLAWTEAVREALPQVDGMTFEELKHNAAAILSAIADALAHRPGGSSQSCGPPVGGWRGGRRISLLP